MAEREFSLGRCDGVGKYSQPAEGVEPLVGVIVSSMDNRMVYRVACQYLGEGTANRGKCIRRGSDSQDITCKFLRFESLK